MTHDINLRSARPGIGLERHLEGDLFLLVRRGNAVQGSRDSVHVYGNAGELIRQRSATGGGLNADVVEVLPEDDGDPAWTDSRKKAGCVNNNGVPGSVWLGRDLAELAKIPQIRLGRHRSGGGQERYRESDGNEFHCCIRCFFDGTQALGTVAAPDVI